MTSAIRFAAAHARMHALKSRLWAPLDRQLVVGGVAPDGRAIRGEPEEVYPGIVRWYARFITIYPTAAPLLRALFRRHEVENVKVLWRAAARGRAPRPEVWRPLAPLGVLTLSSRVMTVQDLVHQLEATPYAGIGRALLRSHGADLPATEIGLDRWVWGTILESAGRLPPAEAAAGRLVRALAIEHDAELLRRGTRLGLEPDLVAKSTVVLSHETRIGQLSAAAAWRAGDGPLGRVLPRALARVAPAASQWDDVVLALRSARLRACRRAFVGWPFRLAPALAALILCEEQGRVAVSVAAARAGGHAERLWLALAASALES
jgi:hypothetical protein